MMSDGIRGLQLAMDRGDATAQRLVEQSIERIEAVDRGGPMLNSVLEMNLDAMQLAEAMDRERAERGPRGPLHGIPVMIKANIDTADRMTTTAGSLALAGSIARRDAFLVERLREAGAILLAKTNLSEWANFRGRRSVSGWSSLGGQTRNPHDPTRSPCGSSSGSAVAVAADLCCAAIGTETDGSIICPAQTCGVVGIKPTVGLVSRSGIIPIAHSQDTAGPMARSVGDAAILLSVLIGADPRDPATEHGQTVPPLDALPSLDDLAGVRIGVARNYLGKHREVDRIFERCVALLSDLGAMLVDPANVETAGTWHDGEMEVLLYEFKHDLNAYLSELGPEAPVKSLAEIIAFNEEHADEVMPHFGQELLEMAEAKGPLAESAYVEALDANRRATREEGIDATLAKHDLDAIIAPSGGPAWVIDTVLGDHGFPSCTSAAAVAGYPHVTVPAGQIDGLPIGLSFFGTAFQDAKLIQYASLFERARRRG